MLKDAKMDSVAEVSKAGNGVGLSLGKDPQLDWPCYEAVIYSKSDVALPMDLEQESVII